MNSDDEPGMRTLTYYDAMSARYDEGRSLREEGLAAWRAELTPYLSADATHPILDLGAGTGIFAEYLCRWFAARVIAIEPSAGMRAKGAEKTRGSSVAWIGGLAERIPVASD